MEDAFNVFVSIRGSPKYWQRVKNELLAKIEQLGPFQLFFTFSCGELRWAEVFVSLLQQDSEVTINFICDDSGKWNGQDETILVNGQPLWDYVQERGLRNSSTLRNNVFHITRIFDLRVKSFIKNILMAGGSDNVPVSHYVYRVEFQARGIFNFSMFLFMLSTYMYNYIAGMPHIHGVAWIDRSYLVKYLTSSDSIEYNDNVIELIDNLVTCELPENDPILRNIVNEVQRHNHTKSCMRNYSDGSTRCRFGAPWFPSERTIIARPAPESDIEDETSKASIKILQKAHDLLSDPNINEDMSFSDFLSTLEVSREAYYRALSMSKFGTVIVLKRSVKERYINNYNKEFLRVWNANMDIQFVHSPYAITTYVTGYVSKDETGMTQTLKDALKQSRHEPQNRLLHSLKLAFLKNRQIGAAEATYHLISGMRMTNSNVKSIYVDSNFPDRRYSFFRKVTEGNDLPTGDDSENEGKCIII